jgi:hypothetical protein
MSQLAALEYLAAGLSVLPARLDPKSPDLRAWKEYQQRLPTEEEVRVWFARDRPLCLVTGAVSGNLEMIDFDCGAELYPTWLELVRSEAPELVSRLVIERSISGGRHVVYRSAGQVSENAKLAQRIVPTPDEQPVTLYGKTHRPRKVDGRWGVLLTFIETRGEGGIFLCAPTPGYELEQGRFTQLPVIGEAERDLLLQAAGSLNEVLPKVEPTRFANEACGRPGDDYNERGDVRELLRKHGWTLVRPGDNEYWRRPGKDSGLSATLKNRVFYVFSSNAAPFEPGRAYAPFSVYALLEHEGDFARAASALRADGYGHTGAEAVTGVDLSALVTSEVDDEPLASPIDDPGPIPPELFRVPGFISEVMDHCLATAPYPNPALAFSGALALQAFLAGRRVRDQADNRTNVYLLSLAHSSSGKDWPRKINTQIVHQVGLSSCLGDRFASGEGLQDALFVTPAMLFQTDEIDGMLQSINKAKDARHESIMSTLLTMYSASNSVFPRRRKAAHDTPGVIDQPCLVVYGTAIPAHYYESLSERMLTNGFLARMIVIESGTRGSGQEPSLREIPARVLDTARWWVDFHPGTGNLESWHPVPQVVPYNDDALHMLIESRRACEAEYSKAESRGDAVGTTVWGRVNEHTRKLALIYAVSEGHRTPCIRVAAVAWATRFAMQQARRMLFMAQGHVADNPFHAECLRFMQKLREAPHRELRHSVALKRMKMDTQMFQKLVQTLVEQGDVALVPIQTAGRTATLYRLRSA